MYKILILAIAVCIIFIISHDEGTTLNKHSQLAIQKLSMLNAKIQANTSSSQWYSLGMTELFIESMNPTINTKSDEMPLQTFGLFKERKRPKLIHTIGTVSEGMFIITNNPKNYSGVFLTGAKNVILRFSFASQPDVTRRNTIPALSIKLLRSNAPSANLFGMYQLFGQESWNFFKHDLTNHVPALCDWFPTPIKLLVAKFKSISKVPSMLGLSDAALYDEDGTLYDRPKFPYRLVFRPAQYLRKCISDKYPGFPMNEVIASVLKPGLLYDVFAQDAPLQDNTQIFKIGEIHHTPTFKPTSSKFGDETMFFQHTIMEKDLLYRPDWKNDMELDLINQSNAIPPLGYLYGDIQFLN